METDQFILAFDTSNETVSVALGVLCERERSVRLVAGRRIPAHRASNTLLLPSLDELLREHGVQKSQVAAVACGRGPGSFTGVRICMATAKGMASAWEVPLIGVSTPDALAWELWEAGQRGRVLVLADAMRKEVYPVHYAISDGGIERLNADKVVKAEAYAQELEADPVDALTLCGDALEKYADLFAGAGTTAPRESWTLAGPGLLRCVQQLWQADACDPFDRLRHDPALALPVYTRLSDAEENERVRSSQAGQPSAVPASGTRGPAPHDAGQGDAASTDNGSDDGPSSLTYRPLRLSDASAVAALEAVLMAGDAWNDALVADDIPRRDRCWWGAFKQGELVGYAGGQVIQGVLQVLKVAVAASLQRQGIAHVLLARVCADARDLGADQATLEVRAGNEGARAFYEHMGLACEGVRPGYYGDGEDAAIYTGPLLAVEGDVAGMSLVVGQAEAVRDAAVPEPLLLAIESSCDETAAAVAAGDGTILADVLASQIDFHARFGGVVPEIASRKHIEAICGVVNVCLERASARMGRAVRYRDLDAIAVTYAPGLVGALVVGVAFAKAAAWAAEIPFIGVNHLEGHLYANKLAQPDIQVPLVVSLVSGGHTMLVHVRDWGDYEVLGSTIDDAVGEAFDKVAKALGLGYPGGPVISRLAAEGDPDAIDFPRAMMHSGDLRFSLSGLKTAVITYIHAQQEGGEPLNMPDIAASFQKAVIDVQVSKAMKAVDQCGAKEFCLGGGVAANPALRAAYEQACAQRGVRLTMPPMSACTDNAAMIALVALDRYAQGRFFGLDADAHAHSDLNQAY